MANLGPLAGPGGSPRTPVLPRGEAIGRYVSYLEAQRAVDFLSDAHFPVQFVTIVGSGLRMVERVTGRLSYPRVAGAGAASGAWFGLFVGILMSLFSSSGSSAGLLAAIVFGAGFGMLYGVISYAFTRGRRDFTSTSQIVAGEYEVMCHPDHAQAARTVLAGLPGGMGQAGQVPPTGGSAPLGPLAPGPAVVEPPSPAPSQEDNREQDDDPLAGLTYGEAMERRRREERAREEAVREDSPLRGPEDAGGSEN
jgi:hypothetical protein